MDNFIEHIFNITNTSHNFSSHLFYDSQDNPNLIAVYNDTSSNKLRLTNFRLDSLGKLVSVSKYNMNLSITPVNYSMNLILGAFDHQNYRYVSLEILEPDNSFRIIWIKIHIATKSIKNYIISNEKFVSGYINTELVGGNVVTYAIKKNGEIVRMSININAFTTPDVEVINQNVNNNYPPIIKIKNSIPSGHLFFNEQ